MIQKLNHSISRSGSNGNTNLIAKKNQSVNIGNLDLIVNQKIKTNVIDNRANPDSAKTRNLEVNKYNDADGILMKPEAQSKSTLTPS